MQKFDMHIQVTSKSISTIIAALDGECEIISITPLKNPTVHKVRRVATRPGQRKAEEIVLSTMQQAAPGTMFTLARLGVACKTQGLSPRSASPAATFLVRKGKIKRVGQGTYALA